MRAAIYIISFILVTASGLGLATDSKKIGLAMGIGAAVAAAALVSAVAMMRRGGRRS